ncbi:hypothetical protein [Bdellovibrio sp.]|uniref:hypothetical protein n=1 Tax=Bdellovibrio TaxID=958 RepID=UPI0032214795
MKFSLSSDKKLSERSMQLEELVLLLCPDEDLRPLYLSDDASLTDLDSPYDDEMILVKLRERFGDNVSSQVLQLDLPDLLQSLYGDQKC